jgi:hypothetical protein
MGVIHLPLTQLVPLFRLSQTIGFLMTIIIGGDSIDHNFMIKPKTPPFKFHKADSSFNTRHVMIE